MRRRYAPLWLITLALGIGSGAAEPPSVAPPPELAAARSHPVSPSDTSIVVLGLEGAADALVTERPHGPSGGTGSRHRWIRLHLPDRPSLVARPDVHARHPDHRAADALARGGALSAPSTAPPALRSA